MRALASLAKYVPNMVLAWFQKIDTPGTCTLDQIDSALKIIEM